MELFDLPVERFPIATRAINLLKAAGFRNEDDFRGAPEKEIKEIEGLGPTMLAELKIFLKGRGIALKREKAAKKPPKYDPRSVSLVKILLPKGEIAFSREVPIAGRLIARYGFENLIRIKLPPHINSLRWLESGIDGWGDRFVASFAPIQLVEVKPVEEKVEEFVEEREYKSVEKPKTLKEFLGLRK